MKKILIVETENFGLRSAITGWSWEDPRLVIDGPIGFSPSWEKNTKPLYDCVLRALADGWELLAPPNQKGNTWDWWLIKRLRCYD